MENKLPDHDSKDAICEELANFFLNKIARFRDSLSGYELHKCEPSDVPFQMLDFEPMDNIFYIRLYQSYIVNHVNCT